ncbi:histidine phosphatase family protein [Frigidibacter sp. MR17.14]|uniref:SixA phosphatase family protein n=1 Tax=Frigidibacter sp. MR17.14 TaxID=3126509 RepID=UPI0030130F01
MTLRLILTRHAKSDWGTPGLDDHDRALKGRGRRAAAELGAWLAERGDPPAEVLCSTALRTRQTWEETGLEGTPRFVPALYHAAPEAMLAELRGATAPVVMMLGHNPGIAAFAEGMVASPPDDPEFFAYPTCATLVAEFDAATWAEVRPRTGRALGFFTPSERGR